MRQDNDSALSFQELRQLADNTGEQISHSEKRRVWFCCSKTILSQLGSGFGPFPVIPKGSGIGQPSMLNSPLFRLNSLYLLTYKRRHGTGRCIDQWKSFVIVTASPPNLQILLQLDHCTVGAVAESGQARIQGFLCSSQFRVNTVVMFYSFYSSSCMCSCMCGETGLRSGATAVYEGCLFGLYLAALFFSEARKVHGSFKEALVALVSASKRSFCWKRKLKAGKPTWKPVHSVQRAMSRLLCPSTFEHGFLMPSEKPHLRAIWLRRRLCRAKRRQEACTAMCFVLLCLYPRHPFACAWSEKGAVNFQEACQSACATALGQQDL